MSGRDTSKSRKRSRSRGRAGRQGQAQSQTPAQTQARSQAPSQTQTPSQPQPQPQPQRPAEKTTKPSQPRESRSANPQIPKQIAGGDSKQCPVSMFPTRPPRKEPAPGVRVLLITNLFSISLKTRKKIHSYGITVDYAQTEGDDKSKAPRKIPREYRRKAVDEGLKSWLAKNSPRDYEKKLAFNYVLDGNSSFMFALFNMFANQDSKVIELDVTLKPEEIVQGKLAPVEKIFKVMFHRANIVDVQELVDYCAGRGRSQDITRIQEHLRALNTLIHGEIFTIPRFIISQSKTGIGNVFPIDKQKEFPISGGVSCKRGYTLSVRPGQQGIMLNVANTVGPFYEPIDLIQFITKRYRIQPSQSLPPYILNDLKKELKQKQVEATHINYGRGDKPHYKKYRIDDIGGSSEDKFTLVDKATGAKREISIQQYFFQTYKLKLKYPKFPCIIDAGRKLPIECCNLVDKQRVTRRLNPEETAEVIKKAALSAKDHFGQVRKNVEEISKHKQPLKDFGLDFEPKPIQVEGRELTPLNLIGSKNRAIIPNNGEYKSQGGFYLPAKINKFAVAFIVDGFVSRVPNLDSDTRERFFNLYCNAARSQGVSINEKNGAVDMIPITQSGRIMSDQEVRAYLRRYISHLNKDKFDHAIIVLPDRCHDWLYGYLQYLETSAGEGRAPGEKWTRTSCVKFGNFQRKILQDRFGGGMFLSNLWLKYNTKLGGINYVLQPNPKMRFLQEGYLFISVDVCHPAPGDKLTQSVAATVGMWDLTNANISYCTRLRTQRKTRVNGPQSTVEEVGEIDIMISDILESYRAKKKKLPTHIVILRDGVSEGQFRMVLEFELSKVKQALTSKYQLSKTPEPKLTCLVVQKRHKIRFMRVNAVKTRRGEDDHNIQPGTVVDTVVTHPTDFTFYMAPHKAIQGTARAPHIYMICDEIGFSQDEAQAMIHALSYLSPRCTKSTSIPTPVNLADLAAERGKNIVVSWNTDNPRVENDEKRIKMLNQYLSGLADINYKNTLYYI